MTAPLSAPQLFLDWHGQRYPVLLQPCCQPASAAERFAFGQALALVRVVAGQQVRRAAGSAALGPAQAPACPDSAWADPRPTRASRCGLCWLRQSALQMAKARATEAEGGMAAARALLAGYTDVQRPRDRALIDKVRLGTLCSTSATRSLAVPPPAQQRRRQPRAAWDAPVSVVWPATLCGRSCAFGHQSALKALASKDRCARGRRPRRAASCAVLLARS